MAQWLGRSINMPRMPLLLLGPMLLALSFAGCSVTRENHSIGSLKAMTIEHQTVLSCDEMIQTAKERIAKYTNAEAGLRAMMEAHGSLAKDGWTISILPEIYRKVILYRKEKLGTLEINLVRGRFLRAFGSWVDGNLVYTDGISKISVWIADLSAEKDLDLYMYDESSYDAIVVTKILQDGSMAKSYFENRLGWMEHPLERGE
jgi:hypothetical protein